MQTNLLTLFGFKTEKRPIPRASSVVLVIDMQMEFVKRLRRGESKRIIPNQISVLNQCRQLNIPIIVIEYLDSGTTINKITSVLDEDNTWYIKKGHDDAFYNTRLQHLLKQFRARNLLLMGICADCCVLETARSATANGYKIITSNEVIAGMSCHSKNNSADWYQKNGVWVKSITSMVTKLL